MAMGTTTNGPYYSPRYSEVRVCTVQYHLVEEKEIFFFLRATRADTAYSLVDSRTRILCGRSPGCL